MFGLQHQKSDQQISMSPHSQCILKPCFLNQVNKSSDQSTRMTCKRKFKSLYLRAFAFTRPSSKEDGGSLQALAFDKIRTEFMKLFLAIGIP